MPHDAVEVDLERATARLRMQDMPMPDFGNFVNAIKNGPSVPARVSFDARWSGVAKRLTVSNDAQAFDGRFIQDFATVEWSSEQDGFRFVSDADPPSVTVAAQIGHQQSGVHRPRRGA